MGIMIIDAAELLRIATVELGSLSEVARRSGVNRSTLKRIRNGSTNAPHDDTVVRLMRLAKATKP